MAGCAGNGVVRLFVVVMFLLSLARVSVERSFPPGLKLVGEPL